MLTYCNAGSIVPGHELKTFSRVFRPGVFWLSHGLSVIDAWRSIRRCFTISVLLVASISVPICTTSFFGYPPAVQIDVNAAYVRFCVESGGASSRLSKSDHSCTRGYGKGHRSLSWDARMLAGLGTEVSSEATDGQTGKLADFKDNRPSLKRK